MWNFLVDCCLRAACLEFLAFNWCLLGWVCPFLAAIIGHPAKENPFLFGHCLVHGSAVAAAFVGFIPPLLLYHCAVSIICPFDWAAIWLCLPFYRKKTFLKLERDVRGELFMGFHGVVPPLFLFWICLQSCWTSAGRIDHYLANGVSCGHLRVKLLGHLNQFTYRPSAFGRV